MNLNVQVFSCQAYGRRYRTQRRQLKTYLAVPGPRYIAAAAFRCVFANFPLHGLTGLGLTMPQYPLLLQRIQLLVDQLR